MSWVADSMLEFDVDITDTSTGGDNNPPPTNDSNVPKIILGGALAFIGAILAFGRRK